MGRIEPSEIFNPCGLNCDWCVYRRIENVNVSGCPGCFERKDCPIRDCAMEEGYRSCDECASSPCHTSLQGYQCMKEHYTF